MGRLFPVEAARKRAHRLTPVGDNVAERIEICIDVEELRVDIRSEMNEAIEGQDVGKVIERYAMKNTGIPSREAVAPEFANSQQYEADAIGLLEVDADAVQWLKDHLGQLWTAVSESADG